MVLGDDCEPVDSIKMGPCGLVCSQCRFWAAKICPSRCGNRDAVPCSLIGSECPIISCSRMKKIASCNRDCSVFPCELLEDTIPFYWQRLILIPSDPDLVRDVQTKINFHPGTKIDPGAVTLRIKCFGQFHIFMGDKEILEKDWSKSGGPTQKMKVLLAFLICKRDSGVRKASIINLIWPEKIDIQNASNSFHQALNCLRQVLEPDRSFGNRSQFIHYRDGRYYFDPSIPYWIDTDEFLDCTKQAQSYEVNGDPTLALFYWRKAIRLYRGTYFEGIDPKYTASEFHEWCAPQRYYFQGLYLMAKMSMARHLQQQRQLDLAMREAQDILAVDPAFEPAHCLLMECMAKNGQYESVMRQYKICQQEMAITADCNPSPQTKNLYQKIIESLETQ